jgi:hypothetical protein
MFPETPLKNIVLECFTISANSFALFGPIARPTKLSGISGLSTS